MAREIKRVAYFQENGNFNFGKCRVSNILQTYFYVTLLRYVDSKKQFPNGKYVNLIPLTVKFHVLWQADYIPNLRFTVP